MRNRSESGISFLEILVVVLIFGVITLMAISSLGKSRVNWTLRGEVNRVVSLIYRAKATAAKDERLVRIRFDNPDDVTRYWLEENNPVTNTYTPLIQNPIEVPSQAKMYISPPYSEIYFYPDGKIMVSSGSGSPTMDLVEIFVTLSSNTEHYIKITLYPLGALETQRHFVY